MKRFLKNIIAFIPLSFLFYYVSLCFFGDKIIYYLRPNLIYLNNSGGHLNSRLREAEKLKDVDILVLGSSLAYRGFDPRQFKLNGLKLFNLGSSGQSPKQTKFLLERFIDKMKPKVIIYVVHPLIFKIDGLESTIDIISNSPLDLNLTSFIVKEKNIKSFNTFLYAIYRNNIKGQNSILENKIKDDDTYIEGGYVEKRIQFHKISLDTNEDIKRKYIQSNLDCLNETIFLIKRKGINIILIQPPITKKIFKSTQIENKSFDKQMSSFAQYRNFNYEIILNDSLHFYDRFHLNQLGVNIFNDAVIKYIKNIKPETLLNSKEKLTNN